MDFDEHPKPLVYVNTEDLREKGCKVSYDTYEYYAPIGSGSPKELQRRSDVVMWVGLPSGRVTPSLYTHAFIFEADMTIVAELMELGIKYLPIRRIE